MSREIILIELVHTLFCDKQHASKMESLIKEGRSEAYCYYYLEKSLAECWEMPDHQYWWDCAESIKNDLTASSADDAIRSIYRVLDMIEKINGLSKPEYDFLTRLLHVS